MRWSLPGSVSQPDPPRMLEEMLAVLFLFLTGQPSHRCLQWWWSVRWGKRGALRASTCEVKPQSFVCHSPFTASFPSSTSFPRLSCVTPSYPEERPPGCQEEKGQANFAAMGYIRFQNKSATNVAILYGVNGALDNGWAGGGGGSFKIQHTFVTCFETGYACENDGDDSPLPVESITILPVWFRGWCCVLSCSRVFGGADESRVAGRGVARCRACACRRLCRGGGWCDCVPLWSIIQRRPFGCHAGCSLWFCDGALRGRARHLWVAQHTLRQWSEHISSPCPALII